MVPSALELVGCVIFDHPSAIDVGVPCPGYRCIPGESPIRISGPEDLPSNARWLSNVDVDVARWAKYLNSPKLLNDRYLRSKTKYIVGELGLGRMSGADQAHVVAGVFSNVMKMSKAFFQMCEPPMYSLISGVPSAIGHYQMAFPSDVQEVAKQAFQTWTSCAGSVDGDHYTSVVLPRVSHAKQLYEAELPWGSWAPVCKSQLPPEKDRVKWVVNNDSPCIAHITVNRIDPRVSGLVSFASGAGTIGRNARAGGVYNTLNSRQWATSLELSFLARMADITIHDVYISECGLSRRYALPSSGKLSKLSYSYGILCENLWVSLGCDADGRRSRTPLTAWLHSIDRMACMLKSVPFHKAGIPVTGYGLGRITLAVNESMSHDFRKLCVEHQVIPQAGFSSEVLAESGSVSLPDNHSPEQLLAGLHLDGRTTNIVDIDNQITAKLCEKGAKNA